MKRRFWLFYILNSHLLFTAFLKGLLLPIPQFVIPPLAGS